MAALDQLATAVLDPVTGLIKVILETLPGIVGGIIVLLVGYIVAVVIAAAVRKTLRHLEFNKWVVDKTGLKLMVGDLRATEFVTLVAKWSIFALFFAPAAALFNLDGLSQFLVNLALWIPQLISALFIVLFGCVVAEYLAEVILATRVKGVKLFADGAKILIWFLTGLIALQQVGLAVQVVQNTFLIILTGLVFGVALAFGIGFGLGLQKEAERLIAKARKRF